jgi:hypothetical protein
LITVKAFLTQEYFTAAFEDDRESEFISYSHGTFINSSQRVYLCYQILKYINIEVPALEHARDTRKIEGNEVSWLAHAVWFQIIFRMVIKMKCAQSVPLFLGHEPRTRFLGE